MDGLIPLLAAILAAAATIGGVWFKSSLDRKNARDLAEAAAAEERTKQGQAHASIALAAANKLDQAIQYVFAEEDTTWVAIELDQAVLRELSDAAILVPDAALREAVDQATFALHHADRLASMSDGWSRPLNIQDQLIGWLREVLAAHVRGDGPAERHAALIRAERDKVMNSFHG